MRRCLAAFLALFLSLGIVAFNEGLFAKGQPPAGDRASRRQAAAAAAAAAQAPAADGAAATQAAPEPLRTAGDRPINIEHIRLDLKVDLAKKTVDAKAKLKVHGLRPLNSITLDAVDFEVSKVAIGNGGAEAVPARFEHHGGKLVIDLEPAWPTGKDATLSIDYRVREPKAGLHFFGPTAAEPEVPLTVWSQGESTTNRYWIPCLDRPNQRQTSELVVTAPEGFEVLSNGSLVEQTKNAAEKTSTFHWLQDKPHPSYLITLVIGQYDIVKTEWDKIPVLYYVPKGHKDEIETTFKHTPEMIEFFSKRFGVRYPWDKYAQVVVEQFSAGGMENTSATTLTEFALHDKRSLLDGSSDGLISHELAHQWWGDMVTCRDWSHLWLNEGFASYMEALWDEHHNGADDYAYNMLQKGRGAIAGGKARPVVDRRYSNPDAMFDARSYPKGAFILHMLRKQLGDDAFWKAIQKYGTDNRFQSVETGDFRKALEQVSGRDLERFFYDWTERAGNPVLDVTTEYLSDSKQAKVTVKQTQPGEPFQFPLKIAFQEPTAVASLKSSDKDPAQANRAPKLFEQSVTEKEQTFLIPLDQRPQRVDIDPDQAVLAEIKENKSQDLWLAQLSSPSVAGRIRAVDHFKQSKTPGDREALVKALTAEKFYGVKQEIARALADSGGDVCRDALLEGTKQTDARVRRSCVDGLGKFAKDAKVAAAVKELIKKGDDSYAVEAAALGAYARLEQSDAVAMLTPWLDKPSHRDVLRSAALNGLGSAKDVSSLDTLISWTEKGKPRVARGAAMRALGQLAREGTVNDEQRAKIVKTVSACLDSADRRTLLGAVTTLREMGKLAAPALPALEALEKSDKDERVSNVVKGAIEQIRKAGEPQSEDLKRLRDEVEGLRRSEKTLQDRLDKLEKAGRSTPQR
ncbi:MAG: M1 family aminopeptidase [Gemmataceae bacterium]